MDPDTSDVDALLAHAGWARALARSLVRDPARADDLVQRAWLAALRDPPRDGTPPRRWLAAVLRNFARQDARESQRRDRRERTVARHEGSGGTDSVDDSADIQVRLIQAVRDLPEPSRSAVWARYYEGLAPRAIAKRDDVPVATVKTRIARGLDALRKRFDREHGGDRGAWVGAFVPFAMPDPLALTAIGGVWMSAKSKVAAAILVVGAGAAWVAVAREPVEPAHEVAALAAQSEPAVEPADDREPALTNAAEPAERTPAARAETNPVARARRGGAEGEDVRGRVLDLEGRSVAGLEVGRAKQRTSTVTSAADGTFAIRRANAGQALEAFGPGWATVWTDRIPRVGSDARVTILVARAGRLGGSVLDDDGRPLEDATVDVRIDDAMLRELTGLTEAEPHRFAYSAVSDEEGRFDLGVVPLVAGSIRANADGREARAIEIPDRERDDLVLALDPPGVDEVVVRGTVGSAPKHPVERAHVRVGRATQRTDREGRFRLLVRPTDVPEDGAPIQLVAVSENLRPTTVEFASWSELARRAPAETFEIVLGGDPRRILGRVVDGGGNPVGGARLRASEEEFGTVSVGAHGRTRRSTLTVEGILRNDKNSTGERDVASGRGDGAFEIRGLQERDYRIVVSSTDPLAMTVLERVAAGTQDVVAVLDTSGPRQRVAGRVVDADGRPIADVGVVVDVDFDLGEGKLTSREASTGPAGEFELRDLRGRIVEVRADLGTYAVAVDVTRDTKLDDVRIVVPRRSAIQIDVRAQPELANEFEVRDARGVVGLSWSRTTADEKVRRETEMVAGRMPIVDGRSDVVTVGGDGLTAILLRDGREVARIPIVLAREGVTVVRP